MLHHLERGHTRRVGLRLRLAGLRLLRIILRLRGALGDVLVTTWADHYSARVLHLMHVTHAGVALRRGRPPGRRGGEMRPGVARLHHTRTRKSKHKQIFQ